MFENAPSPSFVNSARDLNKQFPSGFIYFKLKPRLFNFFLNFVSDITMAFGTCSNFFWSSNDSFIAWFIIAISCFDGWLSYCYSILLEGLSDFWLVIWSELGGYMDSDSSMTSSGFPATAFYVGSVSSLCFFVPGQWLIKVSFKGFGFFAFLLFMDWGGDIFKGFVMSVSVVRFGNYGAKFGSSNSVLNHGWLNISETKGLLSGSFVRSFLRKSLAYFEARRS